MSEHKEFLTRAGVTIKVDISEKTLKKFNLKYEDRVKHYVAGNATVIGTSKAICTCGFCKVSNKKVLWIKLDKDRDRVSFCENPNLELKKI